MCQSRINELTIKNTNKEIKELQEVIKKHEETIKHEKEQKKSLNEEIKNHKINIEKLENIKLFIAKE